MKRFSVIFLVLLFCSLITYKISAQGMSDKMDSKSMPLLNQLIMNDLKETGDKLISLAEAMPDKDYSWRPEKGVRSVSEVYVHVASSNYFFLSYLGFPMPDIMKKNSENGGLEKTMTGKKQVVDFLKKSFDDAQKFLAGYTSTDYDTEIELPFGKFTKAQIMMLIATHPHEHLGQSIAYARTNHITPPWSMPKKK